MRYEDEEGILSVEMGDVAFTHSPFIVEINILHEEMDVEGKGTYITITNLESGNSYSEYTEFNDSRTFKRDLRGILSCLFNESDFFNDKADSSATCQRFSISVDFDGQIDPVPMFYITVIYGSAEPYATYFSKSRKIKMWSDLPLTLPFYIDGAKKVFAKEYDDGRDEILLWTSDSSFGVRNVSGVNSYKYVYSSAKIINNKIPFAELNVGEVSYEIEHTDCKDGVYLCWLNNIGTKEYFLFKQIGSTLKVSEEKFTATPTTYTPELYDKGSRQNKQAQRILTLGVSKADRDTYGYVEGVLLSPFVYLYNKDEGAWMRIEVEPGDFERPNSELKDFQFKIRLPEIDTVKL